MNDQFSSRDKLAMAVAYMTKYGHQQSAIMKELGIPSQAEVSRLLSHARQQGWFVTELKIPKVVSEEIEMRAFRRREELFSKLSRLAEAQGSVPLTGIHIIYSGSEAESEEAHILQFGRLGAEHIAGLLKPAQTCAVAWGRTINSVVDGIRRHQPGDDWKHILFFPTSGEPINHRDTGVSASTAAARLAQYCQCTQRPLSLSGIATRIPIGFGDEAQKPIRAFIDKCEDYRRIFNKKDGLMLSVEAIITGIGDATSSERDPLFRETQELEGRKADWLNKRCLGNLGGVWLSKKAKDPDVDEMNKRWLGIQESDFERCGQRVKAAPQLPGVIVVAVGSKKSDILRRALGKINYLVIDHDLANKLLE